MTGGCVLNELMDVGIQVGSLFFYVILGFLARRKQIIKSEGDKVISDLIFYFTMPALTFTSMNLEVSGRQLANAWLILFFAFLLVLGSYLITVLVGAWLNLPGRTNYAFRFATAFANVAYLGFPVAYILFRQPGCFLCRHVYSRA